MNHNLLRGVMMNKRWILKGCIAVALGLLNLVNSLNAEIPLKDHRIDRDRFISSLLQPGAVGAEIGVWEGSFAYHTLLQKQPLSLYLIDPWDLCSATSDPDGGKDSQEHRRAREKTYENICEVFSAYPNVHIIKMRSDEAAPSFPDQFFDYIYVDGDHSYQGVMLDLTTYFNKVKIGGLIIGDDYGWGQVSLAVQDFVRVYQDRLTWLGDPYAEGREGQYVIKRMK